MCQQPTNYSIPVLKNAKITVGPGKFILQNDKENELPSLAYNFTSLLFLAILLTCSSEFENNLYIFLSDSVTISS